MSREQSYRKQLASEAKSVLGTERRALLEYASSTEEYQRTQVSSIQERMRLRLHKENELHKRHIRVDMDAMKEGMSFEGETGTYTYVEKSSSGLLDSIVKDQEGKEFFVTQKRAREQGLASCIGKMLTRKWEELRDLHFPEIRIEHINGMDVAFMEYFRDYKELPRDELRTNERNTLFSVREKAFLEIFNTWIGNWDFKEDHVLLSEHGKRDVGLIDLEMSFDFSREDRLSRAERSVFAADSTLSPEVTGEYARKIKALNAKDRNNIIEAAVRAGFDSNEVVDIVFQLFRRRERTFERI